MKRIRFILSCAVFILVLSLFSCAFAQPPAPQTMSGVTQQEQEIEKSKKLKKRSWWQRTRGQEQEVVSEEDVPLDSTSRILITKIEVEGITILTQEELAVITSEFEGKELSLKDMQKVADLITDEYRKKGFATSRAYLPAQTIKDGILTIKVVESKLGNVEIRGNKYFKSSLLREKIGIEPAGYFDYSALQQSLVYINEHPDRTAKATLLPGKEPGTTDLIIEVKDKLPLHIGFEYDNYGSRYIGKDRYSLVLEHNNLTQHDDKLYLKSQLSDGRRLKLQQLRYTYPLESSMDLGVHFLNSTLKLGEEFKDTDAKGRARIYGVFLNKALITEQDLDLRLSLGFDYKSVKNYLSGVRTSRDEVRLVKAGADIDLVDTWGRTIVLSELDIGIPHIFGGMDTRDSNASRSGAAGEFYKGVFYVFRLQPGPYSTSFLWKNSAQYTNYYLAASEEFQIGGATSVRGYPPAEYAGDKGYYTAIEWSIPFYFISKDATIPFAKDKKWYDALRFVLFYDWATAHLNSVTAGEKKHQQIRGWGFGFRFNVGDDLTCRLEIGYPLGDKTPSDSDHAHPWVEFNWKY